MKMWRTFALGVIVGILGLLAADRLFVAPSAQAQHLNKFQNVLFDFNTTGAVSTLTFFDRDSGEVFLYIASGTGDFQFARRLSLSELGGPIQIGTNRPAPRIPQLPQGFETENE